MIATISLIEKFAKETMILPDESIHGIHHWKQVEENGLLLSHQPETDIYVVNLFAFLHDCKRESDREDPLHGERAAEVVMNIRNTLLKELDKKQIEKLWKACYFHNKGEVSDDPTIGACFDADRLELTRCGILPHVEMMNTPIGKRMALKMNHSTSCREYLFK